MQQTFACGVQLVRCRLGNVAETTVLVLGYSIEGVSPPATDKGDHH